MAVFPKRITLKNSADSDAAIRAAISTGGTDEILPGEVVVRTATGEVQFYTRDDSGNIVTIGGNSSSQCIVAATAPTLLPDGNALVDGNMWFDSTDGSFHVYYGSAWVQISGGGGGGAVDSVNGETGVVSLGIQDMDDYAPYLLNASTAYLYNVLSCPPLYTSDYNAPGEAGNNYGQWIFNALDASNQDAKAEIVALYGEQNAVSTTVYASADGVTWEGPLGATVRADSDDDFYISWDDYPSVLCSDPQIYIAFGNPDTSPVPLADGDILQWVDLESKFKPTQFDGVSGGTFGSG